ncbi:MAG: molybdopterin-dependent oxidoreductase, partial [Chloroflexi bacterium]|nr:molybdopterin-dependent oxidoreductase [Chloroflexota bacterium]
MNSITLQIDGKEVKTAPGATVLKAAQDAGIYIPTLCHDKDLEPYGGCRLCVVEIDGVRGQPTSCTTPAANGMVVRTSTPAVEKIRRTATELIMSDHPADCLICVKNQKCDLQKAAAYFGIDQYRYKRTSRAVAQDTSNPFFDRNLNKCILCARCSRVCNEVRGVGAIDVAFRGFSSVIAAYGNKPIIESTCISCGACVAQCPVGALYLKDARRPDTEVSTVCTYCGVGCGLKLGVRHGRIVSVWGDPENRVSRGYLCAKGHFGVKDMVGHGERLTSPLIRQGNNLIKASWNEALDLVASRLGRYKGEEAGVVSSAKCTNEENYLAQKLARAALGTNNVDQCARLCVAPFIAGLNATFGSGEMTNPISEIGDAACVLAIGTNTRSCHPVAALELWRGVRKGQKLIVINPREIDLVKWSSLWLQNRPGSDTALLMGMARLIIEQGLEDKEFIKDRCENYEAFRAALNDYPLDFVERASGVPREKIVEAARLFGSVKPGMILAAMGITQHAHGTDNVMAVANLAMVTGNVGKPSAGIGALRGQNNVQGACDMGALPHVYPGYQRVKEEDARAKFESAWGISLPATPGLTLMEMMEGAHRKK